MAKKSKSTHRLVKVKGKWKWVPIVAPTSKARGVARWPMEMVSISCRPHEVAAARAKYGHIRGVEFDRDGKATAADHNTRHAVARHLEEHGVGGKRYADMSSYGGRL